jgi:hypothetical protein
LQGGDQFVDIAAGLQPPQRADRALARLALLMYPSGEVILRQ